MFYNLSQPNTTLDSLHTISPYTFHFNGLIVLFIIVIVITLISVIYVKKVL